MFVKLFGQDFGMFFSKIKHIIIYLEKGWVILYFGEKYYRKSRRNTSSLRINFEIWQIVQQKIIG
jgi:hypothetical protein